MTRSFVAFDNALQIPKQKRLVIRRCDTMRAHLGRRGATRNRVPTAGKLERRDRTDDTGSCGWWLVRVGSPRIELGGRRQGDPDDRLAHLQEYQGPLLRRVKCHLTDQKASRRESLQAASLQAVVQHVRQATIVRQ